MEKILNKLNQLENVKAYKNKVLNLFHIEIDKEKAMAFKLDNNSLIVFPYARYFSRTKEIYCTENQLLQLVNNIQIGGNNHVKN